MSKHPEFDIESRRLASCIEAIEARINNLRNDQTMGGDDWANFRMRALNSDLIHESGAMLSEPYFGRLDYREEDHETIEEFYIGKFGLQTDTFQIIDWRTPFASMFYLKRRYHGTFKSPDGIVNGEIFLKRHLEVALGQLRSITDELDRRDQPAATGQEISEDDWGIDPDDYLRMVLEGRRGQGLRDIVATIQEHQNELIRFSPERILIVQGAAGSGKTTVALHRIAYLLFPQEGMPTFHPDRMLIIGSNTMFLSFLKEVLPSLGIQNIPQTTFTHWARPRLRLPKDTTVSDQTLHDILDTNLPREMRVKLYNRSTLKGSLEIRDLIESCVQEYRQAVHIPSAGLTYTPVGEGSLGLNYHVSTDFLRESYKQGYDLPVNQHRQKFINAVVSHVMDDHMQQYQERGRALAERINQEDGSPDELRQWTEQVKPYRRNQTATIANLRSEIRTLVENDIDERWPIYTPIALYDKLLSDREFLSNHLEESDRENLHQPEGINGNLRIEDLAPLLYIHLLLEGSYRYTQLYEHVVVDEAQDLAPFQIWLLRQYVDRPSMTILGDLAQSIHSYRGISNWDQVIEVFSDREQVEFVEMTQSYRATHEIMSFANKIIDNLNKKSNRVYPYSDPFPRHGPPVRYEVTESNESWINLISNQVKSMASQGYQRIAIIGKSSDECTALHTILSGRGVSVTLLDNPEQELKDGLVLLPVHLTKGLEFDACIIANAGKEQYTDTELDGRLLYVAITRALHELAVFSCGESSPYLIDIV